jgi:thioredoxin reductase
MSSIRDVIIVGSGPAGYTAAIYAARADLHPLVFEGSVTAGGALMTTTEVEDFLGFPKGVQGPELMDAMRTQAQRFGADLVTDDVVEVDLTGPVKQVVTGDEQFGTRTTHQARAMADPKLAFVWNSVITDLLGDAKLTGVQLCDTVTGAQRRMDVTGLFIAVGHDPRTELVTGQVDLDPAGDIKVDPPPPAPTWPACSPAVTSSTTTIARPSPPPEPAACARCRSRFRCRPTWSPTT